MCRKPGGSAIISRMDRSGGETMQAVLRFRKER
jgi:hypothetical protein